MSANTSRKKSAISTNLSTQRWIAVSMKSTQHKRLLSSWLSEASTGPLWLC